MTLYQTALDLTAEGFWLFPIRAGAKTPAVKFKTAATQDAATLYGWFGGDKPYNIGIYTGKFGDDGGALLVLDVDNKKGRNGDADLVRLELDGFELPDTRETATPTGGRHLFFSVPEAVRQSAGTLAKGLDTRSRGGFVLGVGSETRDGRYVHRALRPIAPAPEWLVERFRAPVLPARQPGIDAPHQVDRARALERAVGFLTDHAPVACEGDAGDTVTYKVAARLKDLGVSEVDAVGLMADHWNDRCQPPWAFDELTTKVRNAYAYGTEAPGAAAPETQFNPVDAPAAADEKAHPYDELNKSFAFVLAGGGDHILWETTDKDGRWKLEHLNTGSFHRKFSSHKITVGKKPMPVTQEWMEWKGRRSFDGLVFMPEQSAPARFYNLWRGFAVTPAGVNEQLPAVAHEALAMFLEHARGNACNGDAALFDWLMGYFAHLVQRPWDKPLVALVFKGGKGVGKNALIEHVGGLLGNHFLVTSNRRYLIGNFNGHLENCLLFALDEAFWSGDKQAEGTLKDLVTGSSHVIEHKGKEPYTVDNRTRVAIIGNEHWIVPASHDERRFAVFKFGDGRKQDKPFFAKMREGMAVGGDRLLLRHLMRCEISDVNSAPATQALLDQKHSSLEPVQQWWYASLTEGRIVSSDFGQEWPAEVGCGAFREALHRYIKDRNIRSRVPDDREIGRQVRSACSELVHAKAASGYVYRLPGLIAARRAWEAFIGHAEEWA